MIHQILELYSFRMIQKKEIESLVDWTELHLLVAIVREQEAVIFRNDQRAESCPCRLNTELFQYGHTDGFQQKVCPSFCQKLGGKLLYQSGLLLYCHISCLFLHIGCKNTKRMGNFVSLLGKIIFCKACIYFFIGNLTLYMYLCGQN